MIVSICPLYKCNNSCYYCYLGRLRKIQTVLDLKKLETNLIEINKRHSISQINIFGGELSLLSDQYIYDLIQISNKFTANISITSNLYRNIINKFKISVSTSYNPSREDYQYINDICNNYSIDISTVVLPDIVNTGIEKFLSTIPQKVKTISLLKYQSSIYMDKTYVNNIDFYAVLLQVFNICYKNINKFKFKVANFYDIFQSLNHQFDSSVFSNCFILPNGNFGIINYNNSLEYFREFVSYDFLVKYLNNIDKQHLFKCGHCEYYNSCYTEHINVNIKCSSNIRFLNAFKRNKDELDFLLKAYKQM